jgi:ATP-dependent exoDNAse (exonuclease V) beta subunit
MLGSRDKWLQHFVVSKDLDESELRLWLEKPFEKAARKSMVRISQLLAGHEELLAEAIKMARYGFEQSGQNQLYQSLAEMAEFPTFDSARHHSLTEYGAAVAALSELLMTESGFRKKIDSTIGFPADKNRKKLQKQPSYTDQMRNSMITLVGSFKAIDGLEDALLQSRKLPASHYSEDEWRVVRACFTVLRHAYAELMAVFAESGSVDFAEVAALAQRVLNAGLNATGEAAYAVAEGINHILVDEFQDTSRVQHRLLGSIMREWPEREGRTLFVVGDPMQSIYFFRNAEAGLFLRTREQGLDVPGETPIVLNALRLKSNFRTRPPLVERLNAVFNTICAVDDGSGFNYAPATPARDSDASEEGDGLHLHLKFVPQLSRAKGKQQEKQLAQQERNAAQEEQIAEIVEICRSYLEKFSEVQRKREEPDQKKEKFRVAILGRTKSTLTPIAAALRKAGLSFRAVDLEPLSDRPEVQDALAMARALLNPQDRLSWLGLLRAPWCGLPLEDLYKLVSEDDVLLMRNPVPELIAERMHLLSDDAQQRLARVLNAMHIAQKARAANPTSALGSWLESVWLQLGGAECVDAAERVNLDLLWKSLDGLPKGEEDLLGTALEAALKELKAQPDPGSSTERGIQLMTLHKSKGMEFEVVIVPEMQAKTKHGELHMLSWLERGRLNDEESDEPTEFLVAPFQARGKERSETKAWVDREIHNCEVQELRRLFYVAATRARDELHLFARPVYKQDKKGMTLADPQESLLKIAWPVFEEQIQTEFDAWVKTRQQTQLRGEVLEMAAGGKVVEFSPPASNQASQKLATRMPTVNVHLKRLRSGFTAAKIQQASGAGSELPISSELFHRRQGGLESRLLGTTLHALLERLAKLSAENSPEDLTDAFMACKPIHLSVLRSSGLAVAEAHRILEEAFKIALRVIEDPIGNWILSPHKNAGSEIRWTGLLKGELRQVQVDRIFQAGMEPLSQVDGSLDPVWWIIDYKSGEGTEKLTGTELEDLRGFYAPQIETYARVFREMHTESMRICGGIYYPRPRLLDWWKLDAETV